MSQQNQCGLLEEVLTWDQQMCSDNLDTALPAIISTMEHTALIEEGIGILKIISQTFIPCVPTEELEDKVFSRVCKLIHGLIDGAISKINLTVKGAPQDTTDEVRPVVMECLEWIKDTISCVDLFIKQVLSVSSAVELSFVQSLPFCAVQALKEAYGHCKDSTSLYGDLLDHVGDLLADLFKTTHCLQVSLVDLLNKICISGTQLEDHVQVLSSVCTGLFEICGIVTSLDVKLVISLWKAIVKVCSQHIHLLRDRFDACPLINSLCEEIRQGYKYLFDLSPGADSLSLSQGDDMAFSKSCKILGFQMKVVVALLRDFTDYLGNCEQNVLDLLMFLHRYIPPSLCAKELPVKLENEVRTQIVNATSPILGHLVQNRVFRAGLTSCAEERATDDHLPRLLVQLMLLDILPKYEADVVEFWLSPINYSNPVPTRGLLSSIFDSVQKCELEMRIPVMLPGVMVAGKPQRQVSLYEYTTTHLCGFIGACPARQFTVLESCLLQNVLNGSDLSCLISMDCWCFLVRYGTAFVCSDQVQILLQVFKQLPRTNHKSANRLRCLLQRLVKFMSPNHQHALVKQFSPSDEPDLWISLGTSCLSDSLAESVRQDLISWGLSVLQVTRVKALKVLRVCKLFMDILRDCPLSACMSLQQQMMLLSGIRNIWTAIQSVPEAPSTVRQYVIVELLHLTSHLLPVLEMTDILQVLTVIQASTKHPNIASAAAYFLSALGNVRITPSFQQSQILTRLPEVFQTLLSHPDPLVEYRALEAFVHFASHTVHTEALASCLQGDVTLCERVEHFQNRMPYQSSKKEFVLVKYLASQLSEATLTMTTVATPSVDSNAGKFNLELEEEVSILQPDGDSTAVAVDEGDISSREHPAKRARLATTSSDTAQPLDKEASSETQVLAPVAEVTRSEKYKSLLETLSTLARDMELETSKAGPPPLWFINAAKEAMARVSSCLSLNNN